MIGVRTILRRLMMLPLHRALGTITHVETDEPIAALTFDDGPHPLNTPRLLEILQNHKARATFFMVGKCAERYPDIVKRVALAGHAIGNHSWDHSSFPLLTRRERILQVRRCERAIVPFGLKIFRPPFGHQNIASRLDLLRLGYQVVAWNVVAFDWLEHTPQLMIYRLMKEIKPGCVILFHDALYTYTEERHVNREPTLELIEMLFERLSRRFRFVTLPQLLSCGRPHRQSWYQQGDPSWLNNLKKVSF